MSKSKSIISKWDKVLLPCFSSNARPLIKPILKALYKDDLIDFARSLNAAITELHGFPSNYSHNDIRLIKTIRFMQTEIEYEIIVLEDFRMLLGPETKKMFDKKIKQHLSWIF